MDKLLYLKLFIGVLALGLILGDFLRYFFNEKYKKYAYLAFFMPIIYIVMVYGYSKEMINKYGLIKSLPRIKISICSYGELTGIVISSFRIHMKKEKALLYSKNKSKKVKPNIKVKFLYSIINDDCISSKLLPH